MHFGNKYIFILYKKSDKQFEGKKFSREINISSHFQVSLERGFAV